MFVVQVETVGDCYVAACGLPDPRPDHALVMARYACDCKDAMQKIRRKLEKQLGPDTRALDMRFGLHSGPVTAGVIRGKNPRFQLFGDSMNKTSRIESSGEKGRVHISEEMAERLIQKGKEHWLMKREDVVDLKGLGKVPTYWLNITTTTHSQASHSNDGSVVTTESEELSSDDEYAHIKNLINDWQEPSELISWHANFLFECLSQVDQARQAQTEYQADAEDQLQLLEKEALFGKADPLDSIQFDAGMLQYRAESSDPSVPAVNLLQQLKDLVQQITNAYCPHAFHSIQHASHVVLSLKKMLDSCEVNPFDPLTHFSLIVAALVHDVDHPGVPNLQLVEENDALAKIYKTSVAERNSLDVFWNILNQPSFTVLRRAIYQTSDEFEHFRQVMVQAILATDIMDKSMQQDRLRRAEACARPGSICSKEKQTTSLIENLMQAADISHTMQSWELYHKWNGRLFDEMSAAYSAGRGTRDPAEFWYKGEFGFFDFVVIPLANRLGGSEAFEKFGKEMSKNAAKNREEWAKNGEAAVKAR